jgi:hypothetical protein
MISKNVNCKKHLVNELIMEASERAKQLNNLDEQTVRNHPHTAILASMGVKIVNGFKV